MRHDRPTHIYVLRDPRDNRVRYVGKTLRPRARLSAHRHAPAGQHRFGLWLKELRNLGHSPVMEVIEVVPADVNWVEREIYWIAYWRQREPNLTNTATGGQDAPSIKQTEITVRRRIETIRANPDAKSFIKGAGRSQWPSDIKRKEGHPDKYSPEWKAKIAITLKARFDSLPPEEQERIKANGRKGGSAWTGKKRGPMSDEWKQKIREKMLAHRAQQRSSHAQSG